VTAGARRQCRAAFSSIFGPDLRGHTPHVSRRGVFVQVARVPNCERMRKRVAQTRRRVLSIAALPPAALEYYPHALPILQLSRERVALCLYCLQHQFDVGRHSRTSSLPVHYLLTSVYDCA